MNAASKAAAPPDTISNAGDREYLSLVYNLSFLRKLIFTVLNHVFNCDILFW